MVSLQVHHMISSNIYTMVSLLIKMKKETPVQLFSCNFCAASGWEKIESITFLSDIIFLKTPSEAGICRSLNKVTGPL